MNGRGARHCGQPSAVSRPRRQGRYAGPQSHHNQPYSRSVRRQCARREGCDGVSSSHSHHHNASKMVSPASLARSSSTLRRCLFFFTTPENARSSSLKTCRTSGSYAAYMRSRSSRWRDGRLATSSNHRGWSRFNFQLSFAHTQGAPPPAPRTVSRFWFCQPFSDPLRPSLDFCFANKYGIY